MAIHWQLLESGWGENCLTEAAATAYQDLYDNKNGMLDDLGAFWAKVAALCLGSRGARVRDHERAICGRLLRKAGPAPPGHRWRHQLAAHARRSRRAHPAHDRRHLVFMSPSRGG